MSICSNFQNASPRKCCGDFLRNSTQPIYLTILQTGGVSPSVLTCVPLAITCQHGRKHENSIMREVDFLKFSKCISRKCSGYFLRNPTQVTYLRILDTGTVTACVLTYTPLAMTCEHGRKHGNSIMGEVDL